MSDQHVAPELETTWVKFVIYYILDYFKHPTLNSNLCYSSVVLPLNLRETVMCWFLHNYRPLQAVIIFVEVVIH